MSKNYLHQTWEKIYTIKYIFFEFRTKILIFPKIGFHKYLIFFQKYWELFTFNPHNTNYRFNFLQVTTHKIGIRYSNILWIFRNIISTILFLGKPVLDYTVFDDSSN